MNIYNKIKILFEKILIILLMLIFCISLLEISLPRFVLMNDFSRKGILEQYKDYYRLQKNVELSVNWAHPLYSIYTNSLGCRDIKAGEKKIDNKPCYIFLGASDVFGNGLDYQNTFVGIISKYAEDKGIEVLNLAVGGHRIENQIELLKDLLENNSITISKVFLCVNPVSLNTFNEKRENIRVINGNEFHIPLMKSSYINFLIKYLPSTFIFFAEHWRKIKEISRKHKLPPHLKAFSNSNKLHESKNIEALETLLTNFELFCREKDIDLIYVYLPLIQGFELPNILMKLNMNAEEYDIEYYEKLMEKYSKKENITYINTGPILKMYHEKGKKLMFDSHPHYNEFASKIVSEYILSKIFPKLE